MQLWQSWRIGQNRQILYGDSNGRVVLELGASQIEVSGMPIPTNEIEPVSRKEQFQNLTRFAWECAKEIGLTA